MDFLDENIQQSIKKGLRSMTQILYNEMYVYIWFICIYHVLLVVIVLTNLILLVKMMLRSPTFSINSFPNNQHNFQESTYKYPIPTFDNLDLSDFEHKISGFISLPTK